MQRASIGFGVKTLSGALLWLLVSAVSLLAGDKWPGIPFATVRAYAWPGDDEPEAVILEGMHLAPGVLNKEGALLSAKQVGRVRDAVTGKHPSHPSAACYVPHNALVLYNAGGKPVAFVEICFTCLGYRAQPKTPDAAKNFDLLALAALFSELHLPMGEYADLPAFKKAFAEARKNF